VAEALKSPLTLPLEGKKTEPTALALNEPDTEAIPYKAALPFALPAKSDDSAELAGINVEAKPLAENEANTNPPAAGVTLAVELAENVAFRFAVPGAKAFPVADELKSEVREPVPRSCADPVAEPLKLEARLPVEGKKAEPVALAENEPDNEPVA
jgi:hypothetical protein